VAEFHQQQLHDILKNEQTIQCLERLVVDLQGQQNRLAVHTEDLLRNVIAREEEIIEKVKIWREDMVERIIQFRKERDKHLKEKTTIISALFKMREREFQLDSDRRKMETSHINCKVRHLLAESRNPHDDRTSEPIGLEIGPSGSNLNEMFGILSEQEMSSDEISLDETEKSDTVGEDEDGEEEFYDCKDLQRYKFRTESINGIIP
jgi:hypothetical protein